MLQQVHAVINHVQAMGVDALRHVKSASRLGDRQQPIRAVHVADGRRGEPHDVPQVAQQADTRLAGNRPGKAGHGEAVGVDERWPQAGQQSV
jgi:hypothetical protein